jgi:hypothetical protein
VKKTEREGKWNRDGNIGCIVYSREAWKNDDG